jgi:hypothetical protein
MHVFTINPASSSVFPLEIEVVSNTIGLFAALVGTGLFTKAISHPPVHKRGRAIISIPF